MIDILIVDDHPVVRRGIRQILGGQEDFSVTGEAESFEQAVELLSANCYDVVLLDLSMPDGSGLDLIDIIKRKQPGVPVLVLSIFPAEQYAVRVLRAGAAGYLTKHSAPEELLTAVRRIADGHKYVDAAAAEHLADALAAGPGLSPHESLSQREYQVLCLIGEGKTVQEISERLFLSPKTVSTYRSRILTKMRMRTSAELVRYVLENYLVE